MIDIHTHLYMPQFDDDRDEAIKRAFDAGITMMISVSTEPADHHRAIAITEKDERIFASVGLHPHYFNEQVSANNEQITINNKPSSAKATAGKQSTARNRQLMQDIAELQELAQNNPKIIAIGECGLDYFSHTDEPITEEQKAWQKEGFKAQIQLALELRMPVIIHCRDAYEDVFEILRSPTHRDRQAQNDKDGILKQPARNAAHSVAGGVQDDRNNKYDDTIFILHCYMGDTEVTKKFLTLPNVYFSFTGNITYAVKKALEGTKDDIRETVKMIPLERMFTETDCPFLAPTPYRGKRNEPQFVGEAIKKIAEIHGRSPQQVSEIIQSALDKVFTRENI